jgi:Phytanoyl-CoA dioxygenase (PhyH)
MEGSQKAREIALILLEEAKLPESVVKALLNKATDLGYWRQLNPQLSVGSDARPEAMEQRTLNPPELANIAQEIAKAGYFQAPKILSPRQLGELRSGVERVRDEGWPAVFTFVYDEFWAVLQTPSILRILESRLGPRFKQNSLIWTYYVPTVDGSGGWPPHTDGRRRHLTIWIPLTDATLDNGCMYVVEHHRVPRELNTDFRD